MEPNCKSKFNLDHIYCHPNDNNYIRANAGTPDVLGLLKENKHLKAMLLLHLDLIQEQSDQIMTKDRVIANLRKENDTLKLNLDRMEKRNQLRNQKNEILPSMCETIEIKKENTTEIKSTSNKPLTVPAAVALQVPSPSSTTQNNYKICDETFPNDSIIGESNGKLISKIILQRVAVSNDDPLELESIKQSLSDEFDDTEMNNISKENISIKMELENQDIEDTHNFEHSILEQEHSEQTDSVQRKRKRLGFMTTKHSYPTREWEYKEINDEANREEMEAVKIDAPNLEIPKWTIKEFTGLYSIEGTEDLSDDVFLKRHAKLEYDEKRRKKWDVQRIREQRTIERLRRRHYKDEIQENENQEVTTFYPTLESIKFIQLTEDLPVQAFGDCIPRILPTEFNLPWRESTTNLSSPTPSSSAATLSQNTIDTIDSALTTFVFLKKKRRLQSQGTPTGNIKRIIKKQANKN